MESGVSEAKTGVRGEWRREWRVECPNNKMLRPAPRSRLLVLLDVDLGDWAIMSIIISNNTQTSMNHA